MQSRLRTALALAAATILAGCAALPGDRGYAESRELIASRIDSAPAWPQDQKPAPLPTEPLGVEEAIRLAFSHSPRIRETFARIGLGRAELEDARRIENPTFGYARLDPASGDGTQITHSVSVGLGSLLLLPARKRFAAGELERVQQQVAAELLDLAAEVEAAWFASVSASQVAAMRDVVAEAASTSETLAQRFLDAGNISRLQLAQEQAAATIARIEATRAAADALEARFALASLIGLPANESWSTRDRLPAPVADEMSADDLVARALQQRLDLSAARQHVALREDALGVTQRWRWLGAVELGYEREHELDGGVLRGPSLSLQLPIFNQGQGAVARAQAELVQARAGLDALALKVHNDARLGLQRLAVSRQIVERYRDSLLPQREAIVAGSQKELNFMLIGVFELLLAKQAEFDAYQEYLEAVRDYWLARSDLKRIAGGRLPGDAEQLLPDVGVEEMLPPAKVAASGMDHSMHGGSGGAMNDRDGTDPHAGHDMSSGGKESDGRTPVQDPHAGHDMSGSNVHPEKRVRMPDPHAGHHMSSGSSNDDSTNPERDATSESEGDQP